MDCSRSTDDRGEVGEDHLLQGAEAQTAQVCLQRTTVEVLDLILARALGHGTLVLNLTETY